MLHIFTQVLFWAENQGNHQNFDLSLLKKTRDCQLPQFSIISGIGPWVSRINWCKGNQCGSTYMVIRLSDVSSKKTENAFVCVFSRNIGICRCMNLVQTHKCPNFLHGSTYFSNELVLTKFIRASEIWFEVNQVFISQKLKKVKRGGKSAIWPKWFCQQTIKPSLSMKILSTNLLSKLLSDLYIGVHVKGTKKFGSKVINRQLFHRKTVFHMKILFNINFTTKLLSFKNYFLNGPQ